jgi:hypothetical protein
MSSSELRVGDSSSHLSLEIKGEGAEAARPAASLAEREQLFARMLERCCEQPGRVELLCSKPKRSSSIDVADDQGKPVFSMGCQPLYSKRRDLCASNAVHTLYAETRTRSLHSSRVGCANFCGWCLALELYALLSFGWGGVVIACVVVGAGDYNFAVHALAGLFAFFVNLVVLCCLGVHEKWTRGCAYVSSCSCMNFLRPIFCLICAGLAGPLVVGMQVLRAHALFFKRNAVVRSSHIAVHVLTANIVAWTLLGAGLCTPAVLEGDLSVGILLAVEVGLALFLIIGIEFVSFPGADEKLDWTEADLLTPVALSISFSEPTDEETAKKSAEAAIAARCGQKVRLPAGHVRLDSFFISNPDRRYAFWQVVGVQMVDLEMNALENAVECYTFGGMLILIISLLVIGVEAGSDGGAAHSMLVDEIAQETLSLATRADNVILAAVTAKEVQLVPRSRV